LFSCFVLLMQSLEYNVKIIFFVLIRKFQQKREEFSYRTKLNMKKKAKLLVTLLEKRFHYYVIKVEQ
jgi:hypothetical protein